MDWNPKVETAKKALDKFGVAMSVVVSITGGYNATNDTIAVTSTTYPVIALMKNPTIQRESGEFGKSDRVRLLIAAKGLPANLDELDYHVIYGTTVWHPDTTVALKPGGVPILFTADMK